MNLLHQLLGIGESVIGMHPASNNAGQAIQGTAGAQGIQGGPAQNIQQPPDFTYNPNPNTNIPFSSHNLSLVKYLAQLGKLHGMAPQGFGGMGLDNQAQASGIQGGNIQPLSNMPQGGQYNPGYIPMQGSMGPMGNTVGLQNAYTQGNNQQFGGGTISIRR